MMRAVRVGGCLVGAAALLLAGGALADPLDHARLDGHFSTQDSGQTVDGENEVCFDLDDDDDIEVEGEVQSVTTGGCTAFIGFDTDHFNKVSSKKLMPGKTSGNGKLQQQLFADIDVGLFDTDALDGLDCDAFFGEARPERCAVKASLKGTRVPDTFVVAGPEVEGVNFDNDTVEATKARVKCEVGEGFSELDTDGDEENGTVAPPSPAQVAAVVAAFEGRQDVSIDDRGRIGIKHDGVPEVGAAATPRCED